MTMLLAFATQALIGVDAERPPPAARRLQSQNTSPAEAHGRVATCSHRAFARGAVRAVSGYRDTQSLGAQGVVCRGARIDVVWASPD